MGMETAAWPLPEGMMKLRRHWTTYMPRALRALGRPEMALAMPKRMVSMILPSVRTTRIARAMPTMRAP